MDFIILLYVIQNVFATDNVGCKLTKSGMEYTGKQSTTITGESCIPWAVALDESAGKYHDLAFPDGSRVSAQNWCRNPRADPAGPWCAVAGSKPGERTLCDIKMCQIHSCRLTGPGMEYHGNIHMAATGEHCQPWTQENNSNACRNSDEDLAGPWCFIAAGIRAHCNVPFCTGQDIVLTKPGSSTVWSTFGSNNGMGNNDGEIEVSFRLWSPSDWLQSRIVLVFSSVTSGIHTNEVKQHEKWGSAIIIAMSNIGCMLIVKELLDRIESPGILQSDQWTTVKLQWKRDPKDRSNMAITVEISQKPVPNIANFLQETRERRLSLAAEVNISNWVLEKVSPWLLGVGGVSVLWDAHDHCEEITVGESKSPVAGGKWWSVRNNLITFYVRASAAYSPRILLAVSPYALENITLYLNKAGQIRMQRSYHNGNVDEIKYSANHTPPFMVDKWVKLQLRLQGSGLALVFIRDEMMVTLMNITDPLFRGIQWFSIASSGVVHWTIYCDPSEAASVDVKEESQCWDKGETYLGAYSIGKSGSACLPWIDKNVPLHYRKGDGNLCRNMDNDASDLPFCYTTIKQRKETCEVPPCTPECRRAGTGADYTGELATTRSGRTCLRDTPCRGTLSSLGGPSCPTGDPNVSMDFCAVPDCDRPLECTMFTRGGRIYVLPDWKQSGFKFWVKNLDPLNDSLPFGMIFTNVEEDVLYRITIGEEDKVKLYVSINWKETLVQEKTVPKLITSSKWCFLYIQFKDGSIELGHKSSGKHLSNEQGAPLVSWVGDTNQPFIPVYIDFQTNDKQWIGIAYPCSECVVERAEMDAPLQIWPLKLWNKMSNSEPESRGTLDFYVNVKKGFLVHFLRAPDESNPVTLTYTEDSFTWKGLDTNQTSQGGRKALDISSWTKLTFQWTETTLKVLSSRETLGEVYSTVPFLIYWFSVAALDGAVQWSGNCKAHEPGDQPIDGNWGEWDPWNCSKSCDGGDGIRSRHCNNPPPNLLGRPCLGLAVYHDVCNDFPCGTIPPELIKRARKTLSSSYISLILDVGKTFTLNCAPDLINQLLYHIPNAKPLWTLNGFPLNVDNTITNNYSLNIPFASEANSGVYVCSAENNMLILAVAAVVVKPKEAMVRATTSFDFSCPNANSLTHIYGDLNWVWRHNGTVWRNFGMIQPGSIGATIEHIVQSDAGNWTCVVSQIDLGFHWTVQWIIIKITEKPSMWSYLLEDKATKNLFFWLKTEKNVRNAVLISICGFLFLLIVGLIIFIKLT